MAVSAETTQELLDLLCFYGDRDPVSEGGPQTENAVSLSGYVHTYISVYVHMFTIKLHV